MPGWTHATNDQDLHYKYTADPKEAEIFKDDWQNKMFMPAKYARTFIKVMSVRTGRIADISKEDAIAEGCPGVDVPGENGNAGFSMGPVKEFKSLWNSINSTKPTRYKKGDEKHCIYFPFDDQSLEGYLRKNNTSGIINTVIVNPWVFVYDFILCDRDGTQVYTPALAEKAN